MSVDLERWQFTVADYHRMAEIGIIHEDDRVELIDGEIVKMSPIGDRHLACVDCLTTELVSGLRRRAWVRVQGSIRLGGYAEPQPDIVLLKPRPDFYVGGGARADDVLLIVEVADSSLRYDREVKAPRYAQAGIP
jgi:Uma2 family endonuclease